MSLVDDQEVVIPQNVAYQYGILCENIVYYLKDKLSREAMSSLVLPLNDLAKLLKQPATPEEYPNASNDQPKVIPNRGVR